MSPTIRQVADFVLNPYSHCGFLG